MEEPFITPVRVNALKMHHEFKQFHKVLKKAYRLLEELDAIYSQYPNFVFELIPLKEAYEGLQKQKPQKSFKSVLRSQSSIKFLSYHEALVALKDVKSVTLPLVLKTHYLIQHKLKTNAGSLRTKQNWIGPEGCKQNDAYFFPPKASDVGRNLRDLFGYFKKSSDDPLIKLGLFFAQFLIIHPFMDGNGRTIRALVTPFLKNQKVLKSGSLFMSGFFKKHRLRYFETLYEITEQGKFDSWMRFFLSGVVDSASSELKMAKRLAMIYDKCQEHKAKIPAFSKLMKILFEHPILDADQLNARDVELLKSLKILEGKKQASLLGMPRLLKSVS